MSDADVMAVQDAIGNVPHVAVLASGGNALDWSHGASLLRTSAPVGSLAPGLYVFGARGHDGREVYGYAVASESEGAAYVAGVEADYVRHLIETEQL